MFIYPSTSLQQPAQLLSMLGSFWARTSEDSELVERLLRGRAVQEQQIWNDLQEAIQARGRQTIPVYHTRQWQRLSLLQSEASVFSPDSSAEQLPFQGYVDSGYTSWPAPDGMVSVPLIFSRLSDPGVSFADNLDFVVLPESEVIVFRSDPFQNPLLSVRNIQNTDGEFDQELSLWMFGVQFDTEQVYRNWGYILDLHAASSPRYLESLNVILDALTSGSAYHQVGALYSALTGLPLAKQDGEVVEEIGEDSSRKLVITDHNVYQVPSAASVSVAEGQTLRLGDAICDSLKVYDLTTGVVPDELSVVFLGDGFLTQTFSDEISFENQETALIVTEDGGQVYVEFALGGLPSDVEKFWRTVREREASSSTTLASLMRINPDGPVEPANLPATVNPLKFLIENFLRFNAILVDVNLALADYAIDSALPQEILRLILSPGTTVLATGTHPKTSDSSSVSSSSR